MVDAHAVEHALAEPAQDQRVRVGEDPLVLHAQADQGVDVEEAPIAEIAAGRAPERQPIVLALEQRVKRVGIGVELADHGIDGLGDLRLARPERASWSRKTSLSRCRRRTLTQSVAVDSGSWPRASAMNARASDRQRSAAARRAGHRASAGATGKAWSW